MSQKNMTEEKFLTDKEVEQVLATCKKYKGKRDSILIRLALYTGARGAEILELKKSSLGDCCVSISGKKHGNDRTVPLPKDFFEELTLFCQKQSENDCIFPICTKTFHRIWKQYSPNSNKTSHCLRHTNAVKLYKKSRDIHAVKYLLGHRSLGNTMIYLDFVEGIEKLRETMQGMWAA